ncbi:GHMP kinase, C-terminal domain [Dillenia turbinata]|uniref:GHMP kinase, C-terminal domain n=1 Tax=Dillenia turbinata TaxID=194707 RepID=A0AAN8W537_9MAGN
MGASSWPSESELDEIRKRVAEMGGTGKDKVRVVVSPYRICPLGAHIDHQGGTVSAMTINKGILLGFIPSGQVKFRIDEIQHSRQATKSNGSIKSQEEFNWGKYARGALYALQSRGNNLTQVGVAYLLAFEIANNLTVSPSENIEYDRIIENEFLGLKNGILDQSAILLSSYGCLTCMNCKTKEHKLIHAPQSEGNLKTGEQKSYKILLAVSGLKEALTNNPGYNHRVLECQEAARVLLHASGFDELEPLLSNDGSLFPSYVYNDFDCSVLMHKTVEPEAYEAHKGKLELHLARRAEHYFSENARVMKGTTLLLVSGLEAWASGRMEEFGKLISASGLSSIKNYECGCEPLIALYEILVKTPGVYGARFSGAGFRGCCIAFVAADQADKVASFVGEEYKRVQPQLASQISRESAVLICDAGDCAHVI